MHRERLKTWLGTYRRVVGLLICALVIALAQAAIYPWLYRASNEELYRNAYAAVQRGAHAEALRLLRQLHRRVPSYEISHFLAGWAHHCRKEYDAALQAYRLAETYTPHYAQTYANAGYILFEQGRYEDAARYFRTHLEHAPDHAGSRAMLEECQRRLERHSVP